jgi:hypothetical protein
MITYFEKLHKNLKKKNTHIIKKYIISNDIIINNIKNNKIKNYENQKGCCKKETVDFVINTIRKMLDENFKFENELLSNLMDAYANKNNKNIDMHENDLKNINIEDLQKLDAQLKLLSELLKN